jgi:hypothetical protein
MKTKPQGFSLQEIPEAAYNSEALTKIPQTTNSNYVPMVAPSAKPKYQAFLGGKRVENLYNMREFLEAATFWKTCFWTDIVIRDARGKALLSQAKKKDLTDNNFDDMIDDIDEEDSLEILEELEWIENSIPSEFKKKGRKKNGSK